MGIGKPQMAKEFLFGTRIKVTCLFFHTKTSFIKSAVNSQLAKCIFKYHLDTGRILQYVLSQVQDTPELCSVAKFCFTLL